MKRVMESAAVPLLVAVLAAATFDALAQGPQSPSPPAGGRVAGQGAQATATVVHPFKRAASVRRRRPLRQVPHVVPRPGSTGLEGRGRQGPSIKPARHAAATGIQGEAVLWPIAPTSRPGEPDSRPVPNATIVVRRASGTEVFRQRADSLGRFHISLAPGSYVVSIASPNTGNVMPRPIPQSVTLSPGDTAHVRLTLDSGIR